MNKLFIYILFTHISIAVSYGQRLYVVEKNDLFGYVDSLGNIVIEPMYGFVYTESFENIAFVAIGKKVIAIDKGNKHLFRVFKIDNGSDSVSEGLFRIIDDKGMIGYADTLGNIVIAPQYKFAYPFENKKAKVTNKGRSKSVGEYSYWKSKSWYYIDHPIKNSKVWNF